MQELETINPAIAHMVQMLYGEGMGARSGRLAHAVTRAVVTRASNWAAVAHRIAAEYQYEPNDLQSRVVRAMDKELEC
jgi:hypothetical protein